VKKVLHPLAGAIMSIQSYRELKVWQRAMDLIEQSYQLTRSFPADERFGLISQIRRASISIAANIAEGQGRNSTKEFLNHLSMARGSLMELETLLLASQRVGLITQEVLTPILATSAEVSRMISGLRQALEKKLPSE
jgi:four helix bundle protein